MASNDNDRCMSKREDIVRIIHDSIDVKKSILSSENLLSEIEKAAELVISCYQSGGKVLLMGNGGSAADAQHISAEFVGRFVKERKGLPAIALSTDTSIVTAVSNDYGYENLFQREIEAYCLSKDVVIGISTSGNSENIFRAFEKAKEIGAKTIGLLGKTGGKIAQLSDVKIIIDAKQTARIQESHIMIGHIICDIVENELFR